MSDTSVKLDLSLDNLQANATKIADLDTRIAAATGNEASVKKALAEKLANDHAEQVNTFVEKVIAGVNKLPEEVVVGLTFRLSQSIETTFGAKVEQFLESQVKNTVAASEEQIEKIKAERKSLVEIDKALRLILDSYGMDVSTVPEPKKGGGRPAGSTSAGAPKSGKNKEGYRYIMDGKERPNSQNTFSSLAYFSTKGVPKALNDTEKADARWGVKQLRDFLDSSGVKFGQDDTWEIKLPNGRSIGARRMTPAEQAEVDATEEETPAEPTTAEATAGATAAS